MSTQECANVRRRLDNKSWPSGLLAESLIILVGSCFDVWVWGGVKGDIRRRGGAGGSLFNVKLET
jgi:hypothetical protein